MRMLRSTCFLAIGLMFAACGASEPEVVSATTTTTSVSTTSTVETSDASEAEDTIATTSTTAPLSIEAVDSALSIGEQYIETFNSHNPDSVMSLISSESVFANNFGGEVPRATWHELLIWNAAQGTSLTDATCAVTDVLTLEVVVECQHGTHDAVSQAVGGPPVPTVTTLTVSSNEIVSVFEQYSSPDFNHVRDPFNAWLQVAHPDVFESGTLSFGAWTNETEAREYGTLVSEYAADWALFLDQEGCTFLAAC